ncbi:MAG: TolC family protein [Planctomycetota bacterium]
MRVGGARRPGLVLLAWAAGLALSGCFHPPAGRTPDMPLPAQAAFVASGDTALASCWWRALGDAGLDTQVQRALTANRDLLGKWHAVREARAVARRTRAQRSPRLDVTSDASVSRSSRDDEDGFGIGAAAAFEVDLHGKLAAAWHADVLLARARLSDHRTAALSLSAEVARTWYRLAEAEAQAGLAREQVATNHQILGLMEPRVAAQQLRSVDLLRQEGLVEATRERIIDAEADAQLLRHELAVLVGGLAGAAEDGPPPALVALPELPATGVPIEQLRGRPDVQAAAERVMAADQELGVALRDRYPRLELSAVSGSADAVFREFVATFAAGLLGPVLDGGHRRAEVDRTRAQRDRLCADYAQTVLVAFREVQDALVEERRQRDRLESLARQLDVSEQASTRLREDYLAGQGSYLDVLSALTDEQEIRREQLETRRLVLEARIGLYRALAGSTGFCCKEDMP